ncbi:hypothetical protein EAMG_02282 [Escherichia coli M056]|nr:hypothetical protein EAMG_02282 [Escherichia coli M056]
MNKQQQNNETHNTKFCRNYFKHGRYAGKVKSVRSF